MSALTVLEFATKKIRFENRDGQVWVSLTDMAKATGKKVNDFTRLNSTKSYITVLSGSTGFPADYLIYSNESEGPNEQRGTWAIKQVALKFAAWCSVEFEIWVYQQIETLLSTGKVELEPSIPKTYAQALMEAAKLAMALEEKEQQLKLLEIENKDLVEDVDRLSEVLDELYDYSSIIRVAKFNNCSEKDFSWRKLKTTSKALNLEIKKVPCPRYGTKNLYHHDAWRLAYPGYKLPETTTIVLAK